MHNGCGGEGSFKFDTLLPYISKLPFVDKNKLKKLYKDIELDCCNPHDDDYDIGGGLIAFLRANYKFSLGLITKLYWTTKLSRLFVFLLSFFGLNIFGVKFFNWKLKK